MNTATVNFIVREIRLHFIGGGSDKVYEIDIESLSDGTFDVMTRYGRRGSTLNSGKKNTKPLTEVEAEKLAEKTRNEKTGKGYSVISDSRPQGSSNAVAQNQPVAPKVVKSVAKPVFSPMLLNPITEFEASGLIHSNEWVMQLKADGERQVIHVEDGVGFVTNRTGKEIIIDPVARSIFASLEMLGVQHMTLDCERVGDVFYVFDVLRMHGKAFDLQMGFVQRFSRINSLEEYRSFDGVLSSHLRVVRTAHTTEEKLQLSKEIRAANLEGMVFKRKNSPYVSGRPNSGGDALKFKLVDSATVRVSAVSATKRSVSLEVIDETGSWTDCGNCTIPANYSIPAEKSLVEINYLYANKPSNALYQPVYKGERKDLDESACQISQFKFKSELETV